LSAAVPADPAAFRVLVVDDDRVNGLLFEQACRLSNETLAIEVAVFSRRCADAA